MNDLRQAVFVSMFSAAFIIAILLVTLACCQIAQYTSRSVPISSPLELGYKSTFPTSSLCQHVIAPSDSTRVKTWLK